ncbi:MAG: hypothetical protein B7Z66_06945 [Chromatiales bacterium 21-64-14]|nr:MAG: hypothetical protein B7Z66_06945 [Chromatiales bacterium 21-64-14]HQU16837.1 WGR domain-containing protein [Gammaproteobacteria bacterium]
MRIYLQVPAVDDHPPRFYHLMLQPDLLDGWNVIREWGVQGAAGRVRREHYPNREQAQQALLSVRDQQVRRGYRVVFMEGTASV